MMLIGHWLSSHGGIVVLLVHLMPKAVMITTTSLGGTRSWDLSRHSRDATTKPL